MKDAASERMKRVAILPESQPSTSKAESSRSRWLAAGIAESSFSAIEMRLMLGVAVSETDAVSVCQPEPTSVLSTITS